MPRYDRLSALDASFLHLERLETPMHVGAVSIFEGAPFLDDSGRFRLAETRRLVASRLHLIPRFRKRLMSVPFEMGRPVWVDDSRFDIAYHVRLTALPHPGSREQLLALTSRIQAQLLDRDRPLWELWFVEGLEGGNVGLIQKTHHALVDGVSGVDVATVLLDFTPDPTFLEPPRWIVEPPPSPGRLFVDTIYERTTEPAEIARTTRRIVRTPQRTMARTGQLGRALSTLVDKNSIAPRTSINVQVGRNRRFEGVRISLDDVKSIRKALGGTVNDVVLAGVAGGLRRLFESRGDDITDLRMRALCPVSVRDDSERMQLGNRVSAMFVELPIGEPDPVERLQAIRATTVDLKDRQQAVGAAFLIDITQFAAPTLVGLAARVAHRQPFFNLVITNVPGPQVPLYCMGARMMEAYPVVPLTRNLALGIAILSYCGQLHIGLYVDADAVADVATLAGGLEDSFAELMKIAEESEQAGDAMTDLWARDAWELADGVRKGDMSAVELLDVTLERIEAHNPDLNAVCYLDADGARERAQEIDALVADGGDPGLFAGIPMGVKELAQAKGFPDTHASVLYKDQVAAVDGAEVARLRAAGANIVGLTTAPELGIPSYTNSPLHGITRNPWNPEATPGGSSGGSAAAVAAGMFPACTGSDGGGSIRIPSSYSGLPGFKTTFGLCGSGPEPFDDGLTSVHGPMVRSVRDAARYVDATAGPTVWDPTSLPKPADFEPLTTSLDAARDRLRGKRVAWSSTLGYGVCDTGVEAVTFEAAQQLVAEAGLELVNLDIKFPKPGRAWGLLSSPSLAAWHYDEAKDRLDDMDLLMRISVEGLPHLRASHLGQAVRRRHELLIASGEVFNQVDLLLTPTTATTAYAAEGVLVGPVNGQEVDLMILSAAFTAPFNMTGQPGFSIPAGLVDGMPCGLQVVARRHEDDLCVAAAALMEQARPWPKLAPAYT